MPGQSWQAETLIVDTTVVPVRNSSRDVVVDIKRGVANVSNNMRDEIVSMKLASDAIEARRGLPAPLSMDLPSDGAYLFVVPGDSMAVSRIPGGLVEDRGCSARPR